MATKTVTKTAVEWLIKQVHSDNYTNAFGKTYISIELIEQAKAMEKEQIVEAFNDGALDGLQLGEQYYKFTYNQS
jgi:hypothetical protein